MIKSSGNALFLILIAVALFAALSYAITQSGRGSGHIDKEKAALASAQITQYAMDVNNAIQSLTMMGGCTDQQVSFWHDSNGDSVEDASDLYYNPLSPSDHRCHVFSQNGGGLSYQAPDSAWFDSSHEGEIGYGMYYFTASSWIMDVGINGNGSTCAGGGADQTCSELMFVLPYLKKDICQALNKGLESGTDAEGGPYQDMDNSLGFVPSGYSPFIGGYQSKSQMGTASPFNYSNMWAACIEGDLEPPAGVYSYFSVLIGR